MADEFDKGFPHGLPKFAMRSHDVYEGKQGEQKANLDNLQALEDHVSSPKPGQAIVPDGGQKLLYIWMRYKLLKRLLKGTIKYNL